MYCCLLQNPDVIRAATDDLAAGASVVIQTATQTARTCYVKAVTLSAVSGLTMAVTIGGTNAIVTSPVTFEARQDGEPLMAITAQEIAITATGSGTGSYTITYTYS